jgi:hypothetical protein
MMSKTRTDVEVMSNVIALHEVPAGEVPIQLAQTRSRKWGRPLLFLVCIILALPPVVRISGFAARSTYRQQIMFNEGWNAYYAHAASAGEPLYATRPDRVAVNYPPLSFHIVGALGRVLKDMNLAGRWLSLVSLLWVTLCAALIVRKISGDDVAAALAALFCVGWFAFFAPTYIGVNEPQMLGHALILSALLLYIAGPDSALVLAGVCILCCAGGFVKLNLFPFPVAISLHLLWRSRKRFAFWAAAAVITLAVFLGLTLRVDGPYFFQHLLSPRGYSFARAAMVTALFFRLFGPALVACGVWSFGRFRRSPAAVLILAFLISLVSGIYFGGGSGVSLNVFFDSVIAMSMIAALAVSELAQLAGAGTMKGLAVMAVVPVMLSGGLLIAGREPSVPQRPELATAQSAFLDDVAYVKSRAGPALCLNLLLCYEAGKPLHFDPFTTGERMDTGRLDARHVADELTGRKFSVIQMLDEEYTGFPPSLVASLNSSYRVERRSPGGAFYVPREGTVAQSR